MVDRRDVVHDSLGARVVVQAKHSQERGVVVETNTLHTLHLGRECLHHFGFLRVLDRDLGFQGVFGRSDVSAILILSDECDVFIRGLHELRMESFQVEFD